MASKRIFMSGSKDWVEHETVTIGKDKFIVENYDSNRVGPNVMHEGKPISYMESKKIALRKEFEKFLYGEVNGTD